MKNRNENIKEIRTTLKAAIAAAAPQSLALLCIGNPMRGDDAFGPEVFRLLDGRIRVPLFDGASAPENELPRIAALSPALVLFIDAVSFDAPTGALRLFSPDDLAVNAADTHRAPLSVAADFLAETCSASVLILAARPADVSLGAPMSPEMKRAAEKAARILIEILA